MVANDAQSRLYGAVIDTLERQLSEMAFFQSDETRATVVDETKMKFAPVTNLGCDAEFAKLDVCIVASGGLTSVQTHSCKNIITQEEETGQGIETTRDLQVPPRTRDTNFC